MKIGIFDSGLGGLAIMKAIAAELPQYDYVYLGDTLHVPYGNRSQEAVYELTKAGVARLIDEDCQLIILACNTASAEALRRIQQDYLHTQLPDIRVLGVIVPTAEIAVEQNNVQHIGVIATAGTVNSNVYKTELLNRRGDLVVTQKATPLLVPLIENDGLFLLDEVLHKYLAPLREANIQTLILGCTHYVIIKEQIRSILGDTVQVLSQDEFIPHKINDYLMRHPEIALRLARNGIRRFLLTDISQNFDTTAQKLFGEPINAEKIVLSTG